jgi:hypothetical protein
MCECYCKSKNLYDENFENQTFEIKEKKESFSCKRNIDDFYDPIISENLYTYQ